MDADLTKKIITSAGHAAQAVQAALQNRPLDAVAHALDAALAFVPAEDLAPFLTEAAIRQVKAAKAVGDLAKFGPDGQSGWVW